MADALLAVPEVRDVATTDVRRPAPKRRPAGVDSRGYRVTTGIAAAGA